MWKYHLDSENRELEYKWEVRAGESVSDFFAISLPGFSVHGILQARILEWVAIPFSRGSSRPRNRTQVSHIVGRFFTTWATRQGQGRWRNMQIHEYWVACSGSGDSEMPHTISLLANVDWVLTQFQVLLGSGAYVVSSLIKEKFGDE